MNKLSYFEWEAYLYVFYMMSELFTAILLLEFNHTGML